jgi:hypothetical protein
MMTLYGKWKVAWTCMCICMAHKNKIFDEGARVLSADGCVMPVSGFWKYDMGIISCDGWNMCVCMHTRREGIWFLSVS